MEILLFLLWWLFFMIVTPWVARAKGRSGVGWFLAAVFFSLFALIAVALLPSLRPVVVAPPQPEATGRRGDRPVRAPRGADPGKDADARRPCPECAEMILKQAKKCRFCGASITPLAAPEPLPAPAGMRTCPRCAKPVSAGATTCPHCFQMLQTKAQAGR